MAAQRYYYSDTIADFLSRGTNEIVGTLTLASQHDINDETALSWVEEIETLREALAPYAGRGSLYLEYNIPRMGRRADAIVLIDGIVFVLEYKTAEQRFTRNNCLEDTLTEFKVQGLEIDWACVTWDADLRLNKDWTAWQHFQLRSGTKWQKINKAINQEYQINAYRVLLTRARQGMVIVVPNGDNGVPPDETRKPEWYDGIYDYLKAIGLKEI